MKHFLRLMRIGIWFLLFVLGVAAAGAGAQSTLPVIEVPNPPNAEAQQSKPYVVLVSLDGFRYDYAERYRAKNLLALARRGASVPTGMIPCYPSLTFPNHLTIVTGLYPEHHGIVGNHFYDPATHRRYAYNDTESVLDGSWYGGTPLWVLAGQQGMRSASFFWPGSEAEIQGKRPSYYLKYDGAIPDEKRAEQILDWLKLPADQRPHFLTLYFSIVDNAGHKHTPDSPEVAEAVRHVDDIIGKLLAGFAASHLPVDVIVVSDHGEATTQGNWIYLDQFTDLSHFEVAGDVVTAHLYADSEAAAEKAYEDLRGASDKFKVYRRANLPAGLHNAGNPRTGDPVVVATGPYYIRAHEALSFGDPLSTDPGQHGYDPEAVPAMRAIFYAAGPDIRPGVMLPPFENIHVYPLIAKILGLRVGQIDGRLSVLLGMLKEQTRPTTQRPRGQGASAGVRFDFFPPAP
jgi:predicted AlkP superfamily pyrophosphatase or phosphodiesterase